MKNFEESLRQLSAPDLRVATFRHRLRRDLTAAHREQSLRRWRRACLTSVALSGVLAIALATFVAAPAATGPTLLATGEISLDNDRAFIEAYYARLGSAVRIRSVDDERLVAVREFTLSDGQKMVVYTELNDGQSNRPATALDEWTPILASRPSTTF